VAKTGASFYLANHTAVRGLLRELSEGRRGKTTGNGLGK
jgi:hypothetical protein